MHKATLFKHLASSKVKCICCNHYCIISEGKAGICGVRKNIKGELYLLVYGRAIAANIDPIEKKPLYHFMPGDDIFTVGTIGCNFACEFCQNWDISQAPKIAKQNAKDDNPDKSDNFNTQCNAPNLVKARNADTSKSSSVLSQADTLFEHGYKLMPQDIIRMCKEKGIKMVAFSYNEPTIFFEYAFDTMKLAKKEGIKTVFVSNGFMSKELLEKVSKPKLLLDAINIDLKSFSDDFHKNVCHGRLDPVKENIKRCHDLGIWAEVTTLLIPGENDSEKELEEIAKFLASIDKDIIWHVSAFHPDYKMLGKSPTPRTSLESAYKLGKKYLNHVYAGNIDDAKMSSTYCPKCKKAVIKRDGYTTEAIALDISAEKAKCRFCGENIAGVF